MHHIVQCTYPEKYMPLQELDNRVIRDLRTLLRACCITQFFSKVELKVYWSLIDDYNTQEPLFSGQCEFVWI